MFTLENDDGFARVTIGQTTQEIDVHATYHHLLEINVGLSDEMPDAPDVARVREFNARTVALLEGLGFGRVSHRAADKFARAVFDAVTALGK